jgi:hypothetical protein
MSKLISGYLWAWTNYEAGKKSLLSLKKQYPDADLFVNVDLEGDIDSYKEVCGEIGATLSVNPFQIGYCGNFGNVHVGYEYWPKESSFEWLNQLYKACLKTDSKYMMLFEEDDFVLKPITILDSEFSIAIHPTDPSPTGNNRPNPIPSQFLEYSLNHGGVGSCPGYAAGGGTIFNREEYIKSWEKCKEYLFEDYDRLAQINKIMGWEDFILQFVMMIGGYEVIQNHNLAEHWEVPEWENFEIITGLKDHTLVNL